MNRQFKTYYDIDNRPECFINSLKHLFLLLEMNYIDIIGE